LRLIRRVFRGFVLDGGDIAGPSVVAGPAGATRSRRAGRLRVEERPVGVPWDLVSESALSDRSFTAGSSDVNGCGEGTGRPDGEANRMVFPPPGDES
jgi:hypothetical protein